MPSGLLQVVIVYNKSNVFGLSKDAALLAEALPAIARLGEGQRIGHVKVVDCREQPTPCDICIHLEVPYAVWFAWSRVNVLVVNHEWFEAEKWSGYMSHFDTLVFRDRLSADRCVKATEACGNSVAATVIVPWIAGPWKKTVGGPASTAQAKPASTRHSDGFVWFIGGSPNKRAAAEAILPLWRDDYPLLHVCSLEPLNVPEKPNVKFQVGFLKQEARDMLARSRPGHICFSTAESFGYTAAEAEELGVYSFLNTLPCYVETFGDSPATGWLTTPTTEKGTADWAAADNLAAQLDSLVAEFLRAPLAELRAQKQASAVARRAGFEAGIKELIKVCKDAIAVRPPVPKHMPPLLNHQDCPPISVITLVYNRPKFVENALINLLSTDYPRDKIEWVVVDDSDADQSASNRIVQFAEKFAPGVVTYIPLNKKRSIGYKRNLACERAKHNIFVVMDDDDHYPSTSFRRRVAYLLKGKQAAGCAVCTTIAMYDLLKGTSAVNVPPYGLSLGERCSEATLTFTRAFWLEKGFPDISMAEGEGFLSGRISQVVEMPPQQIIVALNHRNNVGGRKIPDTEPGCFWGFPRPLLEFLHGLVGIKVEAA
jgi:hypothetical protein